MTILSPLGGNTVWCLMKFFEIMEQDIIDSMCILGSLLYRNSTVVGFLTLYLDRRKRRERDGRDKEGNKFPYVDIGYIGGREGREREGSTFPPFLINIVPPRLERLSFPFSFQIKCKCALR